MSIEATFGELKTAEKSLATIAELDLPYEESILVVRMVKKVSVELALLEEQRIKFVKELGVEKDGNVLVPEERVGEFQDRFGKSLQAKITLDCSPLTRKTFGATSVKPRDLLMLGPLLVED